MTSLLSVQKSISFQKYICSTKSPGHTPEVQESYEALSPSPSGAEGGAGEGGIGGRGDWRTKTPDGALETDREQWLPDWWLGTGGTGTPSLAPVMKANLW